MFGIKSLVKRLKLNHRPDGLSLYQLLKLELTLDGEHKPKPDPYLQQQLTNFYHVPWRLETFMAFGLLLCCNSLLTLFTLIPLKLSMFWWNQNWRRSALKKDAYTVVLVVSAVWILLFPQFDISRLYHDVRGSEHIKLYVMFGVLEVADKLFLSLGADLLSILYNTESNTFFPLAFALSVLYLTCHGYILIYQCVLLNVAANSYSNALLALLLLNQFSELKLLVFKKFEREGLFQVAMADLAERFQLLLMLAIIAIRNLVQLLASSEGIIPSSWALWNRWLGAIMGPGVVVIGLEIFVDWLKHCFILKFNRIRPRVYSNFLYVLLMDYLSLFESRESLADYLSLTRRVGVSLLALSVCFLRMTFTDICQLLLVSASPMLSIVVGVLAFVGLLTLRLVIGMALLKWSNHTSSRQRLYRNMHKKSRSLDMDLHKTKSVESTPNLQNNHPLETPEPASPSSYRSPVVQFLFFPGDPNTETSSINPKTRSYLYDDDETVPLTPEQRRNMSHTDTSVGLDEGLAKVLRYKMSSKRIW